EEMNKQLFSGLYHRVNSFFEGTELASSGLPTGLELEILETVRNEVPPEVFTTEYKNPVNGNPEAVRANLREATRLLREAGWEIRNQKLVNVKTGEPMTVELLNSSSDSLRERVYLFYKPALERLGMTVTIRSVDDTQFQNRTRNWDYAIITDNGVQSPSPGNEQRDFWGSQAADRIGSRNSVGIKNPAVDKLIDRVVFAKNRDELVAATHALDRVLLWNYYAVPQWTLGKWWTARWDRFGQPDPLPVYNTTTGGFPTVGWGAAPKAEKPGGRQGASIKGPFPAVACLFFPPAPWRRPPCCAGGALLPSRPTRPRPTASPRSATSSTPPTSSGWTMSIRTPPRAACFPAPSRAVCSIRISIPSTPSTASS